jgi:hypothetical protein
VAIQRPLEGEAGSYTALLNISREISTAWNSGAFAAALAMVYVGIDTMALLACPLGQAEQTKKDFIVWVNEYLRADPASDYQYEGADVYAARCALLHSYGSVAKDHRGAKPPRQFGYIDLGPHRKDETARFALISIAVLIQDYLRGAEAFVQAWGKDPDLKKRVDSRVHNLLLSKDIAPDPGAGPSDAPPDRRAG